MKSEGLFKSEALFKPVRLFILVSTVIYLVFSTFFIVRIIRSSHEFKEYRSATTTVLGVENRMTDITELLSLDKIFGNDKLEKGETSESNALYYYQCTVRDSFLLGSFSILFVLAFLFFFRKTSFVLKYLALSLAIVSAVFLVIGVLTPILEIGVYKDALNIPIKFNAFGHDFDWSKQFDGRIYFFYQIKSIAGVIQLLFENGNFAVASCILLFSVITPVTKLVCTFMVIFSNRYKKSRVLNFIVQYLGKWSMADVFVVAFYLAYFSFQQMSTGMETEANSLIGMYFFLGFVILSLLSSTFLKIQEKKEKDTVIIK